MRTKTADSDTINQTRRDPHSMRFTGNWVISPLLTLLATATASAGPALVEVPERCRPLLGQFHEPAQKGYNLLNQAADLKDQILAIISPDPSIYHAEILLMTDRLITITDAAIFQNKIVLEIATAYADAGCPTNPGSTARGVVQKYKDSLRMSMDARNKFTEAKSYYLQMKYFNGVQQRMEQALGSVAAICSDGWASTSQHRQGTCSWHGGVSTWGR